MWHRCSLRCYPVLLLDNVNSVLCHIKLLSVECVLVGAEGVWLHSIHRLLQVTPGPLMAGLSGEDKRALAMMSQMCTQP